jgi:hypothetical protein
VNGQRDIFGRELEGEAPVVASPQAHEVMSLFSAPQTMRGQLSAWAESVCDEVSREGNRLDGWCAEVIGDE